MNTQKRTLTLADSAPRQPHGRNHARTAGANITDAIVILSRVNYLSVVRVMAAFEAIRRTAGIGPTERLDWYDDVPLLRSEPDNYEDSEMVRRCDAAHAFVSKIANDPANQDLRNVLRLGRFSDASGTKQHRE